MTARLARRLAQGPTPPTPEQVAQAEAVRSTAFRDWIASIDSLRQLADLPPTDDRRAIRQHRARRRGAGRPRRSTRTSARTSDSGSDGPGEPPDGPPEPVEQHARRLGLHADQLRSCEVCSIYALAVDAWQRTALDAEGFTDGACPVHGGRA